MTVVGSCPAEAQKARVAVLIGVIAFVVPLFCFVYLLLLSLRGGRATATA